MNGELLFGTIDTWLVWKMTNGEVHVTDPTNASRTMLYNIRDLKWDERMLDELGIPPPCCRKSNPPPRSMATPPVAAVPASPSPVSPVTSSPPCSASSASKRDGQEHLRYRLLHADEHRHRAGSLSNGLLTTVAIGPKGEVNYAWKGGLHGRRHHPVAAR